jgi:acetamidase/formamidase
MRLHTVETHRTHDRWNSALPPALEVESGDRVVMNCLDSSGGQMHPGATVKDFVAMDRSRIHTITGPVFIQGAKPGDVLEVEIIDIQHRGWGWTSCIAGLGTLPDRFPNPHLFIWKLDGDFSTSLAPVRLPLAPFLGITGVCPPEPGEHRTRPPGSFGGNLDVRDLVPGTRLFLPVFQEGALFSAGDGHAAQGNGEVCINGIEAPMRAEFRFTVRKDMKLDEPFAELPPARPALVPDEGHWAFIASAPQTMDAVRNVVNHAIDFLVAKTGWTPELAYTLCSVALDLRLSQVVNQPQVTVTGTLAKNLFPKA